MKFILGEKIEMTQKYAADGSVIPVTKIAAGPCVVTQVKNEKKEGYKAVQVGFGSKKKISKPLKGHLKNLGSFRYLKECHLEPTQELKIGDKITVNVFTPGDIVRVSGNSKGKGFQGVVRRHGFHGHPASHGHKDQARTSGSIGAGGNQHVLKGTRMAGRMGGDSVTVTNLQVVEIDNEKNEIYIKGAVPGARGGLVLIAGPGEMNLELPKAPVKEEVKQELDNKNPEITEEKIEDKQN